MKNLLAWMAVAMVNVMSYLKCHPIVFQEEADEVPVLCVVLLCVNILTRFLF